MRQHHGIRRRHAVERRVERKSFDVRLGNGRPLLLMPPAPDNPLSRPGVRDRPRDRLDNLVPARRAHQVEVHLVLADAGEVPVALDETRHREPGVQLDHFGRRSDIRCDFGGRSNGDNPSVARGERLGLRDRVVEGDDAAAAKDEVGLLANAALRLPARTCARGRGHKKCNHEDAKTRRRPGITSVLFESCSARQIPALPLMFASRRTSDDLPSNRCTRQIARTAHATACIGELLAADVAGHTPISWLASIVFTSSSLRGCICR